MNLTHEEVEHWRERYAERCAMLEHEAGLSRQEAESAAFREVRGELIELGILKEYVWP